MTLRDLLKTGDILTIPGVYDAMTALLVEQAGFRAAFLSGASLAYTQLGRPDIGLVTLDEFVAATSRIADRIAIPLMVDADTGFGNAANVAHAARRFARAGAAAFQMEDQDFPKRCGHLAGKAVIPAAQMVGKIKAALDARPSPDMLVVARTDAIAVEGFEAALDRAEAYVEAGCDILFLEAPRSRDEFARIGARFGKRVPLLANMVEGGQSPLSDAPTLAAMGFSIALYPGALVRATTRAAERLLWVLKRDGATAAMAEDMHDLRSINAVVGASDLLERMRRYDPDVGPPFDEAAK